MSTCVPPDQCPARVRIIQKEIGGTPIQTGGTPISFLLLLDSTNHFLAPSPVLNFGPVGTSPTGSGNAHPRTPMREGMDADYSWYSAQGPGRMAKTPQAGTGDSVGRFGRFRCSTLFNYKSYFLVGGHFCFKLLFPTQILGLLPNIYRSYILIGLTFCGSRNTHQKKYKHSLCLWLFAKSSVKHHLPKMIIGGTLSCVVLYPFLLLLLLLCSILLLLSDLTQVTWDLYRHLGN